jgi:hypothetical protein
LLHQLLLRRLYTVQGARICIIVLFFVRRKFISFAKQHTTSPHQNIAKTKKKQAYFLWGGFW